MDSPDRTENKKSPGEISQECGIWMEAVTYGSPIPQFAIDNSHRLIYWNPALEKYSGIKAEEVIGTNKHWKAFYPDERPCMADLLIDGQENRIHEFYKGKYAKSALVDGAYEATDFFPDLGKSGVWLYFTAVAFRDGDGRIYGALETLEDITERKEVEEALRRSKERYRNLVENISDVIFTLDLNGIITYISSVVEKRYGFTTDEITGKHFSDFVHPADINRVIKEFQDRVSGDYDEDIFRIIDRQGKEHHVRTSLTPIIEPDGRVSGFNYIMTDITESQNAEKALREANKKLNMLSSITRHDILNMVMVIRGYLEMSEKNGDDNVLKNYILKEKEAVDAIQHQIEFTRYYQDIGVREPKWQNPDKIIPAIFNSLSPDGIRLDNSLKGIEIFADPLIEKVFYNLIENTIRHGGHVTIISLSYMETDKGLIITYRDDGVGIAKAQRKMLFKRGGGIHTGLGLFLSREILSITDITIEENGKEGEGVRFEIRVPKGNYRINCDKE